MANIYKLYFYKEKKGSAVTPTSNLEMSFNGTSYKVNLLNLKYKKKVYEPCEILAELNIDANSQTVNNVKTYTLPKNSEVVSTLLNQKVEMEVEYTKSDKSTASFSVATNYFVYKVRPIFNGSSSSSMTVELGIYSADKLMTLDKYSRAYTAKRLYTDILLTEAANFQLKDEGNTKLSTLVANHMQMLKYKYSSTDDNKVTTNWTLTEELRIPYIVQYNESFYQFLVRSANRYGEFLFFEDGKLNFGMQPSDKNYYKWTSDGKIATDDKGKDIIINWATEPNAVKKRYYESVLSEAVAVEHTAYSYKDHTDRGSQPYVSTPVPASDSDSDTDTDSTTSDSTPAYDPSIRYNFDTEQVNEWLNELENGKYRDQNAMWKSELRHHIVDYVCRCLGYTNLADSIFNLVLNVVKKAISIAEDTGDYNSIMKDENYTPIKNDDQLSSGKYRQFTTYGGSNALNYSLNAIKDKKSTDKTDTGTDTSTSTDTSTETSTETSTDPVKNYTNVFYPLLRKKEKEIGEQAVWLDFGENFKPIMLGDKLKVDDQDYVVINVEGSYDFVEKTQYNIVTSEDGKTSFDPTTIKVPQEKLLVSAVPVFVLSDYYTVTKAPTGVTTTNLDSWSTTLPLPPALPDVLITDARPQVAFVAQYTDPEGLGRIRVRYPWQNEDDDASPWIRVTLPYATSGGCVNFMPSEGDEVMIGYEHGNIDHPYAMGYLVAPFVKSNWGDSLPFDHWGGKHGIKVKTGHHLIFNDGANIGPLFAEMFGPFSFLRSVIPARVFKDWGSDGNTPDCGGGFELSDRYGFYKITGSTEDRNITISSPMGTVNMNAFQGITISAPTGDVKITGKNVTISAANKLNITSGTTINDRFYYQKRFSEGVGNKFLSYGIAFGMDLLDSAITRAEKLIDISFFRCVLEVILRPVDGTLKIKSYTFVQMEAGTGVAEIPKENRTWEKEIKGYAFEKKLSDMQKLCSTVSLVKQNVKALIDPIKTAYANMISAKDAFMAISDANGINKGEGAVSFGAIVQYACGRNGATAINDQWNFNFGTLHLEDEDVQVDELASRQAKRKVIIAKSEALRAAAYDLSQAAKKWTQLAQINKFGISAEVDDAKLKDLIKGQGFYNGNITPLADLANGTYNNNVSAVAPKVWDNQLTAISRYVAYEYVQYKKLNCGITNNVNNINNAADALNDNNWSDFKNGFKYDENKAPVQRLIAALDDNIFKFVDEFRESPWKWKHGYEGKILFSDSATNTFSFGSNQNLISLCNKGNMSTALSSLVEMLKNL